MMKILIIEDEKLLVKGLKKSLEQEGFKVSVAYDGQEGIEVFETGGFDFVILDLMLPKLDGISVCRQMRQNSDVPIIMLTAKDGDIDKILGLELGADDYMTKPFNTRELIARIRAITRRLEKIEKSNKARKSIYKSGNLRVDIESRTVYRDDQRFKDAMGPTVDMESGTVYRDNVRIELTPKEFDILELLIRNKGRVFSREKIFELIWQEPCLDTRTIDVHVKNLRDKLKELEPDTTMIETKWGVGYYFKKD
ncbi:MAG: response regulator transcription factor [Clostridiales bacterium]|nr:response regulator transcription factor [Bacillota bacterium]NLK91385.1 response regulator transcription factor [Clostridiales bacterium]